MTVAISHAIFPLQTSTLTSYLLHHLAPNLRHLSSSALSTKWPSFVRRDYAIIVTISGAPLIVAKDASFSSSPTLTLSQTISNLLCLAHPHQILNLFSMPPLYHPTLVSMPYPTSPPLRLFTSSVLFDTPASPS